MKSSYQILYIDMTTQEIKITTDIEEKASEEFAKIRQQFKNGLKKNVNNIPPPIINNGKKNMNNNKNINDNKEKTEYELKKNRNKILSEENAAITSKYDFITKNYDFTTNLKRISMEDLKNLEQSNTLVNNTIGTFVDKVGTFKKNNIQNLLFDDNI